MTTLVAILQSFVSQNPFVWMEDYVIVIRPAPTTARPQRKRRREENKDVPPCSDSKSPVQLAIVVKRTSCFLINININVNVFICSIPMGIDLGEDVTVYIVKF